MKKQFSTLILFLFFTSLNAQEQSNRTDAWTAPPIEFTRQFQERTFEPRISDTGNRGGDWAQIIDDVWGDGDNTQAKLAVFDHYFQIIDASFACFQDIEDKWQELHDLYRPEIEQGVSRGRFTAMLDQMALSLRESHTALTHEPVHSNTALVPGVPLMYVGGWGNNAHFGAGVTPQPDSTLLVYVAVPNHPLGLVPGDKVLGYDGVLWKDCYKELIEEELPVTGFWWGSSPTSFDHSFLMAAGMNWHLFDTIDIVKYETGEVQHLDLDVMGGSMPIFCTEQMDIPGIPKPNIGVSEIVSFGIVEGTNIGYIYGWGWFWEAEAEFLEAVETLMNDYDTDGLIIDFRMNYGGNMFLSGPALDLLFANVTSSIDFASRCGPDHLDMCALNIGNTYNIGQGPNGYEKPIALLTGPGAISSGDQVALRVKFHPNTRTFGKSTSTAFNAPNNIDFTDLDWTGRYAESDAYLLSAPGDYLTHNEFEVDEEVWLTPESVANGEDDVVNAAIEWINSLTPVSSEEVIDKNELVVYPNPADDFIQIQFSDATNQEFEINIYDRSGRLVIHQMTTSGADISVGHLPKGVYVMKTVVGGEAYAREFVKQ